MSNIVSSFINSLKLQDDYDEDYIDDFYDDDEVENEPRFSKSTKAISFAERQSQKASASKFVERVTKKEKEDAPVEEEKKIRPSSRMERTTNNKIVPIRTTARGLEVCIIKPTSFEDAQDICDMLLSGRAVVVNLEGFDSEEAQRIMDFISGCVYAINGKLHQISKYIFIFSTEAIDISGDYQDLADIGFGVPSFNKEF
jgi:cell division inhibitor SepF